MFKSRKKIIKKLEQNPYNIYIKKGRKTVVKDGGFFLIYSGVILYILLVFLIAFKIEGSIFRPRYEKVQAEALKMKGQLETLSKKIDSQKVRALRLSYEINRAEILRLLESRRKKSAIKIQRLIL